MPAPGFAAIDFDRHVELDAILPLLGYRSRRRARRSEAPREMPSGVYFDLATWQLINTAYAPARVAEVRAMRDWFADAAQHRRPMTVLRGRLGHALAAAAERAKIDVATDGRAEIDLGDVEPALASALDGRAAASAIEADVARIVQAARDTLRLAGLAPGRIDALYVSGGSSDLRPLVERIGALLPAAQLVRGDR